MNDKAVQTEKEIFKIVEALNGRYQFMQLSQDLKVLVPKPIVHSANNRRRRYFNRDFNKKYPSYKIGKNSYSKAANRTKIE